MSMSSSSGSVHRGKLLILIAENGHSLDFDCDDSTLVEAIQKFIEERTEIQLSDQLLLCDDLKLETHVPLGAYKLPSDEEEVFCFNKARLQNNAIPPPQEGVETHDISEPPSLSSNHDPHPLDSARDPALKALPSYERQFRYHYQCGNAIYSRTLRTFEICERLLREQKVQERAMEIAKRNLDHFFRILNQNYMDFLKSYSQQHRLHSDLLVNFPRDIEKLGSCKLIPALQTATRKCLLDLVKDENLRKWLENCSSSHKQFENKVSQFKHVFGKLKQDVEDLFSSNAALPIKESELMIKENCRHLNEQRSIMLSLSKDVSTVKKLVDDCLSSQLTSSLRPHDAVSALGPMYDVHDKSHLPKMRACETPVFDVLDFCTNKKNEMIIFVHSYMQKIAYIQHAIKDVRLQFNAFSEAIKRQDTVFEGLRVVRNIGPAYRACLAEVVRRKASMKLYMGMGGHLAEKLATKRADEMKRREQFLKDQSIYIPMDIIGTMGLFDTPSQCDVHISPFDCSLLDIDVGDIDRYAPESLVGLPFKRALLSMSSSVSRSSLDVEVNAILASGKYESGDLLDEGDLVEIAGISKLEVENAKLKAELSSAIGMICYFGPDVEYGSLDDSKLDNLLKNAAEKTAEALQHKDEYVKHLESMLKAKHTQCQSYEKRIEELGQQLYEKHMEGRKGLGNNDTHYSTSEILDEEESTSSSSNPVGEKDGISPRITEKMPERVDENMNEFSEIMNPNLDSSMLDPHREDQTCLSVDLPSEAPPADTNLDLKADADILLQLQSALEDKLTETERGLKSALKEIARLGSEVENCRKLLDESQMNCAHLENCLHEARQEAQMHLCAADRRASQYETLRASAVKIHGLLERLRTCVNASGGVASFTEALRSLSQSLASSAGNMEEDGTAEFCGSIKVLADKFCIIARQRAELHDRYLKGEAANRRLTEDLEEKKELVKTLYTKHQLEKQANKEKISFSRFEIHEIVAFVLNSSGHYEAVSRSCSNYYISSESMALFTDHLPSRPSYIIGQIVYIERQVVKHQRPESSMTSSSSDSNGNRLGLGSNPFGLPVGCEYFIVTVAMLPETVPPSS